jgi:hypothetical protein
MIYQERMVTELAFAPSFLSFSALSRFYAILTAYFLLLKMAWQ